MTDDPQTSALRRGREKRGGERRGRERRGRERRGRERRGRKRREGGIEEMADQFNAGYIGLTV